MKTFIDLLSRSLVLSSIEWQPQPTENALLERGSTDCPANYTTPLGLNFTSYCNQDIPCPSGAECNLGAGYVVDSMDECMEKCAQLRPPCYAVSYTPATGQCFVKNSTATTNSLVSNSSVNSAFADASQLHNSNLACPYADYSQVNTTTGMKFTVMCGLDYGGFGDFCPGAGPCVPHADTLDQCLNHCAAAHPLCKAVSWNADMNNGYGNCYLKSDVSGHTPAATLYNWVTHSALVVDSSLQQVDPSVPLTQTYTASDMSIYSISQYKSRTGYSNFSSSHQTNIVPCIEQCATSKTSCAGVLLDIPMTYGWNNCYLLNNTGTADMAANATFAIPTEHAAPLPEANTGTATPAPSKAWIAAVVVGCVVLVGIVVTVWLCRRRTRRRQSDVVEADPGAAVFEASASTLVHMKMAEPGHELDAGYVVISRSTDDKAMLATNDNHHELPSTPVAHELLAHEMYYAGRKHHHL